MAELYWITVIGNLQNMVLLVLICSLIVFFIAILTYFTSSDYREEEKVLSLKVTKKASIGILISIILFVFTPSQQQLLIIYGIGNTIDWIQSNNKAKQLPNVAVEALTKYLESIDGQDRNSESN